ncbi:probable E3 ubiquitin-protein ligase HERC3 [Scyliorhinus canicula]|uniref:probable E3 ubiquitin-protein ligase HERC3 n=1 Tax=Scyliorhinus canicula TaxID=7830 RepID=UPI0018F30FCB|nr:probable E3 ubiquitin-protein ligase HERC3 [Scyliorhinus canicula]
MLCWGELGSGIQHKPSSQTEGVLTGQRIQHVCSRDGVTVFVLGNGKVYIKIRGRKRKTEPGPFPHFKQQRIHFAACGTSHILFLSQAGTVYQSEVKLKHTAAATKEFSIMKPQVLKSLSEKNIIQVACGNNHSLALSKDGQLFVWGQNTCGQLGIDTKGASQPVPQCVTSLTGMPVAQITAGGGHSFALSLSGAVFGWGRNDRGQLGLKDTEDRHQPNHVKLLECKKTIHISCGEEHTAVLTKDGLVLTFGAGSYGQLGHNSTKDEIKPRLVGYLFGKRVSQIACGSYHTLAFVASSGEIYSFGRGENGQLGNGESGDQLVPLPVSIMDTPDKNGTENGLTTKPAVRRILAGGSQSFVQICDEAGLESSVDPSALYTLKRIMKVDRVLEKELDRNTMRSIVQAFSSSQSLSASFLDVSKDGHFNTNGEMSGLDMSAVYRAFLKLDNKPSVLEKVKNAVQDKLIPSLPRSPACVETMRVYIILPELIAVLTDTATLTDSLNKAILSLKESYLKILECWWSTMPYYFFMRLVDMYQKKSKQLLKLTVEGTLKDESELHDSLTILQTLYKVNSSRSKKIPERKFRIPVMEIKYVVKLIAYPCIFDAEAKLEALNWWSAQAMQWTAQSLMASNQPICLQVSRQMILQDALEGLRSTRLYLCCPLLKPKHRQNLYPQKLRILYPQGRDLHSNGRIFQRSEDSELLWFPSWELERDDVFNLVGILCGLAVSNGFICNFHFPLALYKKLLHVQPTLEDLKELSPVEGNSLQEVLDYEYDDTEDAFCLDFTVPRQTADGDTIYQDLIPNGSEIPVQKHNRKQYVDAYVDYKLNTSVNNQFEAFARGFSDWAVAVVKIFQPEELRDLIHGNADYEWELLEQNADYDGYIRTDKAVRNFWEVFRNLDVEKKKRFLAFLSGSDRLPVGGIQNLKIAIINTRSSEPDSSYPRAYTCSRSLDLPNYSNIKILREKLLHAIESSGEFNAQEL